MEVTLIQRPGFKVDFSQFKREEEKEITNSAQEIIRFVGVVIHSVMTGAFLTLQHAYSSFTRLIIDTLKVTDFYFGAFKIGYWAFTQGFTFVSTTGRLIMKAYSPQRQLYLSQFLQEGINPKHLQMNETKLDASAVPKTVKVDDLLTYFNKIHFQDVNSPHFMKVDNSQKLRKGLEKFIENVKGRVARIGTPPAHDTVRLENFYQQIEDAVRLSLQKVNDEIEKFSRENPNAETTDDPAIKGQYRNLLEDRSRLVIDLANAGEWCGARYMAEAMEGYFHICGEGELTGSLEEIIFQVLAEKRLKIAKGQIQKHYGTGAHAFSKYMQNMGALLAIPGTENIIEHLSQSFNVEEAMTRFFEEYDEASIIETIQEKLKTSGVFRERVIDWLKAQREGWAPEGTTSPAEYVAQIKAVINEKRERSEELQKKLNVIDQILGVSHSLGKDLPWDEFISELLVFPEVKEIINQAYPVRSTKPMEVLREKMGNRQAIADFLSFGASGELFRKKYQEEGLQNLTAEEGIMVEKVKAIRSILPIDESVVLRIIKKETDLKEVVEGCTGAEHDTPFLQALGMMNLHEQGFRPVHMEWFLDAHHVFYPRHSLPQGTPVNLEEDGKTPFRGVVDQEGLAFQLQRAEEVDFQAVLPHFLKEEESHLSRYQFGAETDMDRITHHIFEEAFKVREEEIIAAAHTASPKTIYSPLRKVVYIDGAALGAKVAGNIFLKLALSTYIIYKLIKLGRAAYDQTSIWADKAHRFLKKESHPQVRQGYKIAIKTHHWIQFHKFRIFCFGWGLRAALNRIPHRHTRFLAGRIAPFSIFESGGSYFGILFSLAIESLSLGWNILGHTSSKLNSISNRETQERIALEKRHAFAVWKALIAQD